MIPKLEEAYGLGIALVVVAVMFVAVSTSLAALLTQHPALALLLLTGIIGVLVIGALAALGYFAWSRDGASREKRRETERRANLLPRRRARPPAPGQQAGGEFTHVGLPAPDDAFGPAHGEED